MEVLELEDVKKGIRSIVRLILIAIIFSCIGFIGYIFGLPVMILFIQFVLLIVICFQQRELKNRLLEIERKIDKSDK